MVNPASTESGLLYLGYYVVTERWMTSAALTSGVDETLSSCSAHKAVSISRAAVHNNYPRLLCSWQGFNRIWFIKPWILHCNIALDDIGSIKKWRWRNSIIMLRSQSSLDFTGGKTATSIPTQFVAGPIQVSSSNKATRQKFSILLKPNDQTRRKVKTASLNISR